MEELYILVLTFDCSFHNSIYSHKLASVPDIMNFEPVFERCEFKVCVTEGLFLGKTSTTHFDSTPNVEMSLV